MAFADRINLVKVIDDIANRKWSRGYYCAVAVLLREEGQVTTAVRSLYAQGGGTKFADAEDVALFAQHGLVPNDQK